MKIHLYFIHTTTVSPTLTLPSLTNQPRFHELAKDIKYNKGGILAATVSYLKMLKMDRMRKHRQEEECRAQAARNRALLIKLRVRHAPLTCKATAS